VSGDHTRLLLGFDTETIFRRHAHEYTHGVFEIKTGKLLWHGSSNALRGLPVFVGDKVFALEAKSRKIYIGERTIAAVAEPPRETSQPTSEIVLAEHSKEGRRVIVQLPLKKGEKGNRYSASPDRKRFVLQVEAERPRLLIVPIRENVTEKDITEVPLRR